MSHHARCVHARYAEAAHERAMELEPPQALELAPGVPMFNMTGALATLIDLACPPECHQGTCAHEGKRAGPREPLP